MLDDPYSFFVLTVFPEEVYSRREPLPDPVATVGPYLAAGDIGERDCISFMPGKGGRGKANDAETKPGGRIPSPSPVSGALRPTSFSSRHQP